VDLRLGSEGVRTTLKTLHESFAKCGYVFLSTGYLNAVCGGEELVLNAVVENMLPRSVSEQFVRIGAGDDPAAYLTDLVVAPPASEHPLSLADVPVNTFNRPVLEFAGARSRYNFDSNTRSVFRTLASYNFERSPVNGELLSNAALRSRCSSVNAIIKDAGHVKDYFAACKNAL
jgi:hypothetical protein